MQDISVVQARLARYYLGQLQTADMVYRRGENGSAESATLLTQDWAQIVQWQTWAAAQSPQNHEAAQICAAYAQAGTDILSGRQTWQERIAWLEAGLASARLTGDTRAAGLCLLRLAWAIHKHTDLDRAEEVARQALAQAEAIRDSLLIGQSLHLLGEIAVRRGTLEQGEELHLRSEALLKKVDAQTALADVFFSLSEVAYFNGRFARARDYALQCHHVYQALGLNQTTNNSLTWLGAMIMEAGDLDGGEAYVRKSIALCRTADAQSTLAHALYTLSHFMLLRKDGTQAQVYLDESLAIAQRIGEDWLIPCILLYQAQIQFLVGDLDAAQNNAERAVAIGRETNYLMTLLYALIRLAEYQLAANAIEQACESLCEGLEAAVQTNTRNDMVYGIVVAARLWMRCGDATQAAEWAGLLLHDPRVEYATRCELPALCAELSAHLGAATFAAAVERGKLLHPDDVAQEIVRALRQQILVANRH